MERHSTRPEAHGGWQQLGLGVVNASVLLGARPRLKDHFSDNVQGGESVLNRPWLMGEGKWGPELLQQTSPAPSCLRLPAVPSLSRAVTGQWAGKARVPEGRHHVSQAARAPHRYCSGRGDALIPWGQW